MDDSVPTTSEIDNMPKMQNLLEEILNIQKNNQNMNEGMIRVQEIVKESSEMVENSTSPSCNIVDATILHVGSSFFNTNVSSLNTNLTSFNEEKYVNEILNYIKASGLSKENEWKALAPLTYHLFRKSHPLTFMLGPLSLQPTPVIEKQKTERQKRTVASEKNVLDCVSSQEKAEEKESNIYEHILKCLVKCYKMNKKQPINYFHFVVDPTDYWKTIENIFYFSFLVRDNTVNMFLKNEVPFIEPVLQKSDNNCTSKSIINQFCCSLSVTDWEICIEKFQIKTSCITPFVKI